MAEIKVRRHAKYCNKTCAKHYQNLIGTGYSKRNIACATVGAVSELLASTDLMNKGFHVFRALSAACPCDLIAFNATGLQKIEVRTGRRLQNGRINCPFTLDVIDKADLLAIVVGNEVIYYTPKEYLDTLKFCRNRRPGTP